MSELPPTEDLLRLTPLADARAARRVSRMVQHAAAPIWRWSAGDRIERADLDAVRAFEGELRARRGELARDPIGGPPDRTLAWIEARRDRVPLFRARLPEGTDLARSFAAIRTSSREDLAIRPELFVPDDAPLDRMIVYRTAGTTGHAMLVPHDPRAAASYLPMIAIALEAWGARAPGGEDEVGAINLGAQRSTVTYACTMSCWGGTGFAKLNLAPGEWRDPGDPGRYVGDLAAHLWTGDPIAFSEALRLGIDARPAALLTTAVALSPAVRDRLAARFGAKVIDWYSLTETGPLAFACPRGEGYHLLAHDVHVEVIDPRGVPTAERGEVTVTGGRNPYVPLLRYRTGDFGRIDRSACACGDPTPRLVDLEGRPPVPLRARDGAPINTVDVARALRPFPLVQHALVQRADASVELTVRAAPGEIDLDAVRGALAELFGDVPLSLRVDPTLGDRLPGKVIPYRSQLPLEE